jgi:hypothetical protein
VAALFGLQGADLSQQLDLHCGGNFSLVRELAGFVKSAFASGLDGIDYFWGGLSHGLTVPLSRVLA